MPLLVFDWRGQGVFRPNIPGTLYDSHHGTTADGTGAFRFAKNGEFFAAFSGTTNWWGQVAFDPSLVNPVYDASDTVQPSALYAYALIRYQ